MKYITTLFIIVLTLTLVHSASAWQRFSIIDQTIKHFAGHGHARCLQDSDPQLENAGAETSVKIVKGKWVAPGGYITFGPGTCEQIVETISNPAQETSELYRLSTAEQFLLLTHEIGHMRGKPGWKNEGKQGCYGIQHVQAVMRFMGLPENAVRTLYYYAVKEFHQWSNIYHTYPCSYSTRMK